MESPINIRNLYKPLQPLVKQIEGVVNYTEILPEVKLQSFIYCYWELKTSIQLEEQFNYNVVADGCIDIFFDLNNPQESLIMGFCKKYTTFKLENNFHYIGIRFLPTMFPNLFKIDASELSNRVENLNSVVPHVANFIQNHFANNLTFSQITSNLDQYFSSHFKVENIDIDNRLYLAIDIILKNYGVLNIEKDLDVGLSVRQLRRLFNFYIGDTQKTFSQVVRFQNILRAKPSKQSLKSNKLFFDNGYYDQSHFIKSFKNFYGTTPNQAFKK